jgi:broad specificity phosphatase PhoE
MPRLYLVRHGHAAAGFGEAADPGLSEAGRGQAVAMAVRLGPHGPLPILVSPLRRTRETALPLEHRWDAEATVEPAIAEIPSPSADPARRIAWLRKVMAQRWADLGDDLQAWRKAAVDRLQAVTADTVVVSHFIAINVAYGAATGDDRVVCFHPDNCSVTVFEATPAGLRLVEKGGEAETKVL